MSLPCAIHCRTSVHCNLGTFSVAAKLITKCLTNVQVQGELEQERARSKTSIGRVRKDLESERDSVNSALTEVRADLDRERERSKTLSSTLEATAERSRTITAQLEAANKQVRVSSVGQNLVIWNFLVSSIWWIYDIMYV